jgi:hypothetical protein
MIIKNLENDEEAQKIVQDGINNLVQQKKEARQNQQRAEQELNNLQNQLNNHVCSGAGNSTSPSATGNSGGDRSQTNEETNKTPGENNEQQIIHQLNQSLNLNLTNPTLNQVISKIQELIHKPPTSSFMASPSNQTIKKSLQDAQQTILKLEQELSEKSTPFGEDLAVIKKLELTSLEELFRQAVDATIRQQIQQATNYQQVVAARQAFLEKHLEQKENIVPVMVTKNELVVQPNKERVVLISLLVVSLIGMGGLLMRLRKEKSKI